MRTDITIGIYGLASQSGMAYFADYLGRGYNIIGYNRPSEHGKRVTTAIKELGGVQLIRPQNTNKEDSRFIPIGKSLVTTDISHLIEKSDIIIIALPSIYHVEAAKELCNHGIWKRRIPIILSPSRTFATPYLWQVLGERYPIVCFSTCPYSCKHPDDTTTLIKRRKRTWLASIEGEHSRQQEKLLTELFPSAALTYTPALTSLNNIGAIFHCATYLLNKDEIEHRKANGESFSFYMEGIAERHDVGAILEQIDQVRLNIAAKLGLNVFGLSSNGREDVWRKLTNGLRALESEHEEDIDILRNIRKMFMQYLNDSVISAAHWLDITYGVIRKEGEALSDTISRTPTYQKNSVPQQRYLEEDIPTGLVPLEAIAARLNIECKPITRIIESYNTILGYDIRTKGRNLNEFTTEQIVSYLLNKEPYHED